MLEVLRIAVGVLGSVYGLLCLGKSIRCPAGNCRIGVQGLQAVFGLREQG